VKNKQDMEGREESGQSESGNSNHRRCQISSSRLINPNILGINPSLNCDPKLTSAPSVIINTWGTHQGAHNYHPSTPLGSEHGTNRYFRRR